MYSQPPHRTSEEEILRKKKALEAQLAEANSQLSSIQLNMNKENDGNRKKRNMTKKYGGGKRNKQPTLSKGSNGSSSQKSKSKKATRMASRQRHNSPRPPANAAS